MSRRLVTSTVAVLSLAALSAGAFLHAQSLPALSPGVREAAWFPDGARIVVSLYDQLWTMTPDGKDAKRLGLTGAAFTAERRIKEIGLRKLLGAKVAQVVQLLVWDFSKPVMLANLIAWPGAWFLMRDWLNGFQYRISLNPGVFQIGRAHV